MSFLDVRNLTIRYPGEAPAVGDLSFSIAAGEALGIVGESGSGKTQTALALMGLLPANASVKGSVRFEEQELLGAGPSMLNRYRACRIAMVFQDPRLALNPYVRIGDQLRRILIEHGICGSGEARRRTVEILGRVGLPDPERQYHAWPHELSGGMRQRAMIGAALIGEPDLLIADEPTTALDVTVQAQILSLMRDLRLESQTALLLITHDLGVVAGNSDRVLVMDKGTLVEEGATASVFRKPSHDRTKALMAAAPDIKSAVMAPELPDPQAPVLEVSGLGVSFDERRSGWGERLTAVKSIDLAVGRGETIAVVGESGSGKTSLVRAVLGLVPADKGTVSFLGETLSPLVNGRPNDTRRHLQMVFQDPIASLNPAMSVAEIIAEPLKIHGRAIGIDDHRTEALAMLGRVGLEPELAGRYPHELSGGQAQRVAIARALVMRPDVLVCDEAVAALDGTVRQGILELLTEAQRESGLSLVFITHDLAVVRQISHRILVMYMGRLCELAGNDALFARPRHPYSRALLRSVPVADPAMRVDDVPLRGETSSMLKPPAGCPFHPRCQHAIGVCSENIPHATSCNGAVVACHRAEELDLSY